jgi:cell division protein FtsQ
MAAKSGASTPAGRKRSAKTAARRRSAGTHKPAKRPASAKSRTAAKPKPKARASKPKSPARPKSTRPKAKRPKAHLPSRGRLASRALTIGIVVGTITLALGAAYWFWFRDSGLIAVEKVTVEGIEGPETAAVEAALTKSAQEMTTLNVDESELAAAVSRFPTVTAIQAEADFPHGLTVEVTDRPPVLNASDGGQAVPVAGDGTLLHGVAVSEALPAIQVDSVPAKGKLEGEPLALAQVAGAAPVELRPMIESLVIDAGEGIEVTLKGGIPVKFGDPDGLEEKWASVAAVLANPQVKTLTHLDVRVPERPSIGGAAPTPKPE